MKILVVDDHELIRDGLRSLLPMLVHQQDDNGVEVVEASSLAMATEQLRQMEFDLVLLDLACPMRKAMPPSSSFAPAIPIRRSSPYRASSVPTASAGHSS